MLPILRQVSASFRFQRWHILIGYVVPRAELENAEQIAAALFFKHVFGSSGAVKGLNFLIALSAFGNLLAVLIGSSRMIRECGR